MTSLLTCSHTISRPSTSYAIPLPLNVGNITNSAPAGSVNVPGRRLEVGTALRRNIRVIPVLVGGAAFPEPEELPSDLEGLRRRNGLIISDVEWRAGTQHLVEAIRR